jgi:hypothetical protein
MTQIAEGKREMARRRSLDVLCVRDLIELLKDEDPDAPVAVRSDPPVGEPLTTHGAAVEITNVGFADRGWVVIYGEQERMP